MADSSLWPRIVLTLDQVEAGQAPVDTLRALVNELPTDFDLGELAPQVLGARLVKALHGSLELSVALREALLLDTAPVIRYGALCELEHRLSPDQMGQLLLDVLEYEQPRPVRLGIWHVFYRGKAELPVTDLPRLSARLQDALHDEDPGVRGRAAYLAGSFRIQSLYPTIWQMAEHDADLTVRADAINGLQHCGTEDQTPAVIAGVFAQIGKAERLVAAGEATLQSWAAAGNREAARWLACRAVMPK